MDAVHGRVWSVGRERVAKLLPAAMIATFIWLVSASPLAQSQAAGQGPRAGAGAGRPTINAVRTAQAPSIDGRLDDAIWRTAAHIDKLVQERPVEGAAATEQTDIRVAYDSEKLYFGIYAHYANPSLIRANRADRDKTDDDDTVTIFLEPFLDYLKGYSFSVNGYGVQRDALVVVSSGADTPDGDLSWNALYYSAGTLVEDGWTAEMAIPIKSLRYPSRGPGEAHRWGFQVRRNIKSKDEFDVWAPVSRNVMAFLPQIGILGGLTDLSTRHNFEVLPTFTATESGSLNATTGEFANSDVEEGGVGLKYGITPQLTFDFTYNPDFSNIESDTQQIEVNQRFPINYPELRPFFLEGQEIYAIPGAVTPVQTRTIVDPRYGAKLTGKIGRTSIGMFVADDEAPGKVDNPADAAFGRSAKVVLGRAKYDLYRNSHIGAIFTDREFLNSHSRLLGFDSSLRLGDTNSCTVRAYRSDRADLSNVRKRGGVLDSSCKKEGRNLSYQMIHAWTSPDFGSQLSFIRRVDQIQNQGTVSYRWWPESSVINLGPQFNLTRNFNFATHVLQNTDVGGTFNIEFAKNITLSTNVHRLMERYREIDFDKTQYGFSGTVNTNRKVLFTGSFGGGDEIRFVVNPWLGRSRQYSASVTFRPSSRLQSVLKLNTTRLVDPRNDTKAIDVKILRSQTTYQFTPRLLVRNITEFNTGIQSNHTLFQNILVTYRVNSGTVFYVGYDDRYKEGDQINAKIFPDATYQRTSRAIFTKLQYLFRSNNN